MRLASGRREADEEIFSQLLALLFRNNDAKP